MDKYYFCEITEINGEFEYTSNFLMHCIDGQDPEQALMRIFTNYRGIDGELESLNFVWFDDGLAAKNPRMDEITKKEYEVMSRYLTNL